MHCSNDLTWIYLKFWNAFWNWWLVDIKFWLNFYLVLISCKGWSWCESSINSARDCKLVSYPFQCLHSITISSSYIPDYWFLHCRCNQKSHVTSNLVHKLYRVQNVGKQPLSYFEKFVSKDDLAAAEAKQKSKQQTWYSLTVDCLNGLLNQVCH
jgi:hypothetical protein